MTSKIVVNNIQADAGVSTVTFGSNIQGNLIGNVTGTVNSSGIATFSSGPVIIGSGTSTGTASQRLQVTGGGYISGSLGVGVTNPSDPVHVIMSGSTNQRGITIQGVNSGSVGSQPGLRFINNSSTYLGAIWGDNGSNYLGLDSASGGSIRFQSNNVETARITSGGDVQIANGNLVFSTSGKGIDFSANSNLAGMTSELLDDYEVGNWTPAITDGYTRTYGNRYGKYVKIGSYVYVFGQINLSTRSGSPGSYGYITLPFAANGMGQIQQPMSICQTYGFTHTSIITVAAQWDAPTELRIYETTTNANSNYLSPSGIPASGEIGFYYVFYTTS